VTVTQNGTGTQQIRTYTYDDIGRLISEINPESGTTTYSYDTVPSSCFGAGNPSHGDLTARQDPAGDNNCYQYDLLHRVTNVGSRTGCKRFAYDNGTVTGSRPTGITITNGLGRMNEAETDNCSATPPTPITDEWFSYTARGEIVAFWESTPHSGGFYPVAASYWPNGAPNGLIGANGYSTAWGVDGEGRVYSAGGAGGPLTSTTYNAASQPTQLNLGTGDNDAFMYDPAGRMKEYSYTVNGQALTGNLTWNANGTLGSLLITDPFNAANTQNCAYTHDDLVRIASVNCGASTWQQNFTYDPFGNITKTIPQGGTGNSFQPTYSATTNHISTIGQASVTYDANGDVTNDTNHMYTWDAFGNATTIDGIGIIYDALDRMVEKNGSGSNSEIIYSTTGFKMQLMNGQAATTDFVPLPAGASVVYLASGYYFRHPDWLGSSRLASSSTRTVLYDGAYAPFGEPYAQIGTDLSFTGMNSDTSIGLYDFPAREYSTQGRWSQPDPAGLGAVDPSMPQTWNRYAYVMNNPLGLTDPTGLVCDPLYASDTGGDPLGNGTQIFTPVDCAASGGTWGSGFVGGGATPGGGPGPSGGSMPGCTPAPDSDNNVTGVAGSPICDPSNTGAGGRAVSGKGTTSISGPPVAKSVANQCQAEYQGSTGGKIVQFFSLYNLATDFRHAWIEWTLIPGGKIALARTASWLSGHTGTSEFLSMTGGTSTVIPSTTTAVVDVAEAAGKASAGFVIRSATGIDMLANVGCKAVGRQAAGQMTPLPPGWASSW
jgi:RHS repeat-associated protein